MKNLYSYIIEDNRKVKKANKKVEAKLRAAYAFVPNRDDNRSPKKLRDASHPYEYIRGYFGKADNYDDVLDNVKTMLTCIGVDLNDINIEYGFFNNESSGKYLSAKITSVHGTDINIDEYGFNLSGNACLYIVNTTKVRSEFKDKLFTPDGLGLAGEEFTSKDKMIKAIEAGLNKSCPNYKDLFVSFCNCINSNSNDMSIIDMINKKITYNLDANSINELSKLSVNDMNVIGKDFGELIGPLVFMDKVDHGVVVSFPSKSNNKEFDYYIDNICKVDANESKSKVKISAKYGAGSASAITHTMKNIEDYYNEHLKGTITNQKEIEFLETIVPILAKSEKSNRSYIRANTWEMIFALANLDKTSIVNKGLTVLEKYFGNSKNLTNAQAIAEKTDELIANQGYEAYGKMITEFYTALDYNWHRKNITFKPETLSTKDGYNSIMYANDPKKSAPIKEGIIIYPFKSAITRYINNSEYKPYFDNYVKLVLEGYQMKMDIINANTKTFNFLLTERKNMEKYRLAPGGSVREPLNKSFSLKIG